MRIFNHRILRHTALIADSVLGSIGIRKGLSVIGLAVHFYNSLVHLIGQILCTKANIIPQLAFIIGSLLAHCNLRLFKQVVQPLCIVLDRSEYHTRNRGCAVDRPHFHIDVISIRCKNIVHSRFICFVRIIFHSGVFHVQTGGLMILHILNKSCILASAEACDRRTQSAGPATLTFGTSANIFKLVRCRHSHGYASAIVSAAAAIAAAIAAGGAAATTAAGGQHRYCHDSGQSRCRNSIGQSHHWIPPICYFRSRPNAAL